MCSPRLYHPPSSVLPLSINLQKLVFLFLLYYFVDAVDDVRRNQVRIRISCVVARLMHKDAPLLGKKVSVGVVHIRVGYLESSNSTISGREDTNLLRLIMGD